MSHIRVLICRVEDECPDQMTELAHVDLPEIDVTTLQPETTLDDLEASSQKAEASILQRLIQARWEEVDAELTQKTRSIHVGNISHLVPSCSPCPNVLPILYHLVHLV